MIDKLYEKLENLLDDFISRRIITEWTKEIQSEYQILDDVAELTKSILTKLDTISGQAVNETYVEFYDQIFDLIKDRGIDPSDKRKEPDFSALNNGIAELFNEIPPTIRLEQSWERFKVQPGDPLFIKVLKPIKNGLFNVYRVPARFLNWIRRVFKKNTKDLPEWHHTVKLQWLCEYHLEYLFPVELEKYKSKLNADLTSTIYQARQQLIDQTTYDLERLDKRGDISADRAESILRTGKYHLAEIKKLISMIKPDLTEIADKRIEELRKDVSITGTIEFPNRKLKKKNLEYFRNKVRKIWSFNCSGWDNTFFSIYDDLRSDVKVYIVQQKLIQDIDALNKMQGSDEYRFSKEYAEIAKVLDETSMKLNIDDTNIRKTLVEAKYLINKQLSRTILPQLSEKIHNKNISGLIGQLENSLGEHLQDLSGNFSIIKSENFSRPLEKSELENISIFDLTNYELMPGLERNLGNIKTTIFNKLGNIHESILGLDKIGVFAIESALTSFETKESDENESIKMALDGVERTKNKLQQIQNGLSDLNQNTYEEIKKIIIEFNKSLSEYTINENALEIKIRIVKSKAIEHTRALRKKTLENLKRSLKLSLVYLSRGFKYVYERVVFVKNRFLLTAPEPVLSREVSDFLSYSNNKIESLPFLYKNLYKIQPVQDKYLFIGRKNELKKLTEAYEKWSSGNFSATALIGEKWGGLTSLISHFTATQQLNQKIIRISVTGRLYDEKSFIQMISEQIGIQEVDNVEALIASINALPSKQIFIIEDIQKMFLRTIHGFEAFKALFKILGETNRNIFWLVSCTIYAWEFLQKTLSIEDYFSNVVIIEHLDQEQVVEIIKRRNEISGLNVIFESDENPAIRKKLKGMNQEEQQAFLSKNYFTALSDFSESNISFALLFWLLSTKEITENKLIIGYFKKLDLSFVKVIKMDRILVLMALILHDGLNELELARVNNITTEEAKLKLIMLLEDGIIYQQDNRYLVNPLIYRNVIKLLKSKNLLQ